LKSITTFLYVGDVGSIDISNLVTVGGKVTLTGPGVTAFPAPKLKTIGGALVLWITQLTALDLPALTSIGQLIPPSSPAPNALDLNTNNYCAPNVGNLVLTQLALPLLTYLGPLNAGTINLGNNPMLPRCRVDALATQLTANGWMGKVLPIPNPPDAGPDLCATATGPCP
jgi:hypothetical protein